MEHLSKVAHYYRDFGDGNVCEVRREWYEKAKEKLGAYEDTGLTPEEVAELARAKKCEWEEAYGDYTCSSCGKSFNFDIRLMPKGDVEIKYCPYCAAKITRFI